MGKLIRYTCQDDGMAFITLANSPVNALSRAFVSELNGVITAIAGDQSVRVLIISSASRHFCVGMDLKEQNGMAPVDTVKAVRNIQDCFQRIASLEIPTICAIHGAALGGGAELAVSCDFRVMEESASIGFPETGLGIIPGAGGTQRLPRLIGISRAKYWIFSGGQFTAEEALADGAADFIVDDGILLESAIELADELLSSGPIALKFAKTCIDNGTQLSLKDGLKLELQKFSDLVQSDDWHEGLEAFIAKRKANWNGS